MSETIQIQTKVWQRIAGFLNAACNQCKSCPRPKGPNCKNCSAHAANSIKQELELSLEHPIMPSLEVSAENMIAIARASYLRRKSLFSLFTDNWEICENTPHYEGKEVDMRYLIHNKLIERKPSDFKRIFVYKKTGKEFPKWNKPSIPTGNQ